MYKSLDTFLFHTPYFSFSTLSDFENKLHEPIFKEMLQIVIPDLNTGMNKKDKNKLLYSTYSYFQRACTRPTPFGLFAGYSVGIIAEQTEIQLLKQKEYKRITRLDIDYICTLIKQIEKNRNVRKLLCYNTNSSIYLVGCHYRYLEFYYRETHRVFQLSQIEDSKYLQKVLLGARKRVQFTELVAMLIDNEITEGEAEKFIHKLIDGQILVSELEPNMTDVQSLKKLIAKLNKLPNLDKKIVGVLFEIEKQLVDIDRLPIGETDNIYPEIINKIKKIRVVAKIKYPFQTNVFKPVLRATISSSIINDIQQVLVFLNKVTALAARTNLLQFMERFVNQYGSHKVSLFFAIENKLGIRYTENLDALCPLIDDFILLNKSYSSIYHPFFQTFLLEKYRQMLQKGKKIIELIDEDVNNVEAIWDDLPHSLSIMCQVLQDNNMKRSVYIKAIGRQSVTNLLSPFENLNEKIIEDTLIPKCTYSDSIHAEIIHFPESSIGNLLFRTVLHPHNISYLAKLGIQEEFELNIKDLYISVKNNRIVLYSKKLNIEIVPRINTAYDYGILDAMPIYHFLCDMQYQNACSRLEFCKDEIVKCFDYLPRVIYKNCIIFRARWTIKHESVVFFVQIKDDKELLYNIKKWQQKRNIPDAVLLVDGDKELYIDLNNLLSIRAWLYTVNDRSYFYLEEFLFDSDTAIVHGPEGEFNNEFIFNFYKEYTTKN